MSTMNQSSNQQLVEQMANHRENKARRWSQKYCQTTRPWKAYGTRTHCIPNRP
jgi:hypothetical protein